MLSIYEPLSKISSQYLPLANYPKTAPATLVNVTISQIRNNSIGSPCASKYIGKVSASGGMGWITASVNDRIPSPGRPKSSDHSI